MKQTNVMVLKPTVPVVKAVDGALKRLRKRLKVGAGGMSEDAWYMACAEALLRALEHVKNNLPDNT